MKLLLVGGLTLVASLLPDIVVKELVGSLPLGWLLARAALLAGGALFLWLRLRDSELARYGLVLTVITVVQVIVGRVQGSAGWQAAFPPETFGGQFGGTVLLKLLGAFPVIAALLLLYRSPRKVYLIPGDLSVRASRIGWLGLRGERHAWGRLSMASGLLIAAGTLLLTLVTVTGFSPPATLGRLPALLPLILLLALANSFSEGVVYRSSVLGPLREALPKEQLLLVSAASFGVAHYYGAPGGVLGVVMSGALGWFMARSMYETGGFLPAWIIHFLQDVVIFATIAVLGRF